MFFAYLAAFAKLIGPDLVIIGLILVVLFGIPAAIATGIVFMVVRRRKTPLLSRKQAPSDDASPVRLF
jgi:hypothetical protein